DSISYKVLLKAGVQFPTPFRTQIGIAERSAPGIARGKEQLIEGRSLESFRVSRLELGSGLFEKIRAGKRRAPLCTERLVIVQADAGNQDETTIKKAHLFLEVVSHITDRPIDSADIEAVESTGRACLAPLEFHAEAGGGQFFPAVVGLKLRSGNLRTEAAAFSAVKRSQFRIVFVLDMLFENRSRDAIVPARKNLLLPFQFAEILLGAFTSVGIAGVSGKEIVAIEQPKVGLQMGEIKSAQSRAVDFHAVNEDQHLI